MVMVLVVGGKGRKGGKEGRDREGREERWWSTGGGARRHVRDSDGTSRTQTP